MQELLALPYRRKEYKAGEMVVRVGDTCDWLMLLAEMLGVARPSLSRIIADLLDEGVLERTEKGIVIRK